MSNDYNKSDMSYLLGVNILQRITQMQDAKSNGEEKKYFLAFDSCCKLVANYWDTDTRNLMQLEYNKLQFICREINKEEINEKSKEKKILEMQVAFANQYEIMIFNALRGMDFYVKFEEGTIDLARNDIDALARIIRARGSYEEISKAIDNKKIVINERNKKENTEEEKDDTEEIRKQILLEDGEIGGLENEE